MKNKFYDSEILFKSINSINKSLRLKDDIQANKNVQKVISQKIYIDFLKNEGQSTLDEEKILKEMIDNLSEADKKSLNRIESNGISDEDKNEKIVEILENEIEDLKNDEETFGVDNSGEIKKIEKQIKEYKNKISGIRNAESKNVAKKESEDPNVQQEKEQEKKKQERIKSQNKGGGRVKGEKEPDVTPKEKDGSEGFGITGLFTYGTNENQTYLRFDFNTNELVVTNQFSLNEKALRERGINEETDENFKKIGWEEIIHNCFKKVFNEGKDKVNQLFSEAYGKTPYTYEIDEKTSTLTVMQSGNKCAGILYYPKNIRSTTEVLSKNLKYYFARSSEDVAKDEEKFRAIIEWYRNSFMETKYEDKGAITLKGNKNWTKSEALITFETRISAVSKENEYYKIQYHFDEEIVEGAPKQRKLKTEEIVEFIKRFQNTVFSLIQNGETDNPIEKAIKEISDRFEFEERTLRQDIERKILPNINNKILRNYINIYYKKKK